MDKPVMAIVGESDQISHSAQYR